MQTWSCIAMRDRMLRGVTPVAREAQPGGLTIQRGVGAKAVELSERGNIGNKKGGDL